MDIYTKLFITNWACILFVMFVDQKLTGNKLGDNKHAGPALGIWAFLSYVSILAIIVKSVWAM